MTVATIIPLTLRSPEDTVGWTPTRIAGREGWRDVDGVEWVRARNDETPEITVVFTQHRGLPPVRLVRADASRDVKRAERKARREARALRVRGYDA